MVRSVQVNKFSKNNRLKIQQAGPKDKPTYYQLAEGILIGYRRSKSGSKWHGKLNGNLIGSEQQYHKFELGSADDYAASDGHKVLSFEQAQSKLHKIKEDYCDKIYTDRKESISLEQAIDLYFDNYCDNRSKINTGYQQYLQKIKSTKIPYRIKENLPNQILGKVRLDDITLEDLESVKKAMANSPRKYAYVKIKVDQVELQRKRRATANKFVSYIKAVLNYAYREARTTHLKSNKEFINFKKYKGVEQARQDWWSAEECQKWLNTVNETSLKNMFIGAISCGFRFTEQSLLKVGDVYLDAETPYIKIAAETTKTMTSRNVLIPKQYIPFFTTLVGNRDENDYLFLRQNGRHKDIRWKQNTYQKPYQSVTKAAQLQRKSWHSLRHTYASQLVNAGVPLKIVADQLGHKTTALVEKWYGHLCNHAIAEGINKLPIMHNLITDEAEVTRITRTNYAHDGKGNRTHQPNIITDRSRNQIWAKPNDFEVLNRFQNSKYLEEINRRRRIGEAKAHDHTVITKALGK